MTASTELAAALDGAYTLGELKQCLLNRIRAPIGANIVGLYFFDAEQTLSEVHVFGAPDAFVHRYEQLGREADPVLARTLRLRRPTHDQLVYSREEWQASHLYRAFARRYGTRHYLCAPLEIGGRLQGTLNLSRARDADAFADTDVQAVMRICRAFARRWLLLEKADGDRERIDELERAGRLRAQRAHLVAHVDEFERDGKSLQRPALQRVWAALAENRLRPLESFDREGRRYLLVPSDDSDAPVATQALTWRERDLMARVARGDSNKAIAFDLGLSVGTVGRYVTTIKKKLGVASRVMLIDKVLRKARSHGGDEP